LVAPKGLPRANPGLIINESSGFAGKSRERFGENPGGNQGEIYEEFRRESRGNPGEIYEEFRRESRGNLWGIRGRDLNFRG